MFYCRCPIDYFMKIKIIAVGKLKEKFYIDAVNEFKKRLSRFTDLEIIELLDEKAPDKLNQAELEHIKAVEGRRILERLADGETVILTDLRGKQLSSPQLSEKLKSYMLEGKSRFCFIIGGSNGVSDEVFKRADYKLSFSALTFSHQIFRIMLLEQLYRAFKIMNGEPYHK